MIQTFDELGSTSMEALLTNNRAIIKEEPSTEYYTHTTRSYKSPNACCSNFAASSSSQRGNLFVTKRTTKR